MPFPWRAERCTSCHRLATGHDDDGTALCEFHMRPVRARRRRESIQDDINAILALIDAQTWNALVDERFPGPDDMLILDAELYEFVHAQRERLEKENAQCQNQ